MVAGSKPAQTNLVIAITIPISTNTTIAICIQIQVGDTARTAYLGAYLGGIAGPGASVTDARGPVA